jgi:hypothetical protein
MHLGPAFAERHNPIATALSLLRKYEPEYQHNAYEYDKRQ